MAAESKRRTNERGGFEELASGAVRVRVYAGLDPLTKRRHYLKETIPAGPNTWDLAEQTRTRLLNEVNERRNPRTSATVTQLLRRYLDQWAGERSTLKTYRRYVRIHVNPLIGHVKVGALDADALDSLYTELRRCRVHCSGKARGQIDHRTKRPHTCDDRCRPHKCKPLGASSIPQIHFILSGAYKKAVRWRWVAVSPITQAEPPAAPKPNPTPPSTEDAARILNEAWRDPDWGTLVWLTMTTGARRGEQCGLRWKHIDLEHAVLTYDRSIGQDEDGTWEKDTKQHQQRRNALDPDTVAVLCRTLDPVSATGSRARNRPHGQRVRLLLRARRKPAPQAGQRGATLRPARRPARHRDVTPQAAPLLRHRADQSRRRHQDRRRPPGSWSFPEPPGLELRKGAGTTRTRACWRSATWTDFLPILIWHVRT